jgi:SNF2 family DNA or RNA helicase
VLVLLLRMRQACVHAALVPRELHTGFAALLASGGVRGGGGGGAGGFSSFDAATLDKLLAKLRESALGGEECAVCLSGIDSGTGVATPCAHVFCRPCMAQLAEAAREGRAVFQCPLCRQPLDEARLLDVAAGEALQRARDDAQRRAEEASKQAAPDDIAAALCARPSSKLEALLRYLREQPADAKTVVFSQWAQLLDLVAAMLAREGYECARLHGSLSQPERTRSLARFRSEPACRVLLATLQTGALGLNLTSASRVVIMDPWWAPALEDQACDRIHRLGQTRAVEIVRFVVPDSVEERVLSLQTQKRELVASVLDARAQPQRSVLRDIMHLFGRSSRARELAVS